MGLPLAVGKVINRFNVGPLTMTRRSAPTKNARGGYEPVTPFTFEVTPIAAHTVDGRQLLQVPEADRNSEIMEFYARTSSFPAGQAGKFFVADGGNGADILSYNGRLFRIVTAHDYATQGGVHIAFGALQDVQF